MLVGIVDGMLFVVVWSKCYSFFCSVGCHISFNTTDYLDNKVSVFSHFLLSDKCDYKKERSVANWKYDDAL